MNPRDSAQLLAEAFAEDHRAPEETLVVDVDGFEGPLDLLLALARQQKVDLAKISILALAEQYLAFTEAARRAQAGGRGGLPRDGRVACLSEVAASPARTGERRRRADAATSSRRNSRTGCAGWRRCAAPAKA